MTLQTIKLGFGKVNLSSANATYAALRVKPPFLKDSAVTSGRRRAFTQITTPVSAYPKINGVMMSDDVQHENGTIIMLQVSWKRGSTPVREGAVLIRLREEAALINVTGALPQGRENLIGDRFALFTGRGDVLSVDEAKVMRIDVPNSFVHRFFNPDELAECFELVEIQPEVVPAPQIALVPTATGLEVKEVAAAPKRRLRIRK